MATVKKVVWCIIYMSLPGYVFSCRLDVATNSCCPDDHRLNYTLPTFLRCGFKSDRATGKPVQTVPKLIPSFLGISRRTECGRARRVNGIPAGERACRVPDCLSNPCKNGWCEETMASFTCHCPDRFSGVLCDKNMTKEGVDAHQPRQTEGMSEATPSPAKPPRDCSEILERHPLSSSSVYIIQPNNATEPFSVFCDMDTDGGGWTVFQRRQDGSVDFYEFWDAYKRGFGNLSGEFWLGNDHIHLITNQTRCSLRVDLWNWENETRYAVYNTFSIGAESDFYRITTTGYSGTAGNSLGPAHDQKKFVTRDEAYRGPSICVASYRGGWWFSLCFKAFLNGPYLPQDTDEAWRGLVWQTWTGDNYSLMKTEMKTRPVPQA